MKKKFALILLALFVCAGMIFAVQGFQKKYVNEAIASNNEKKTQGTHVDNKVKSNADASKTETDAAVSKSNESPSKPEQTTNSSATSLSRTTNNAATKTAPQEPKQTEIAQQPKTTTKPSTETPKQQPQQPVNFTIIDTVHNKVILSCHVDYPSGTVDEITSRLLKSNNIEFKVVSSISGNYYSMIAGLKERDAGPNSGWCYLINDSKASVGASGYTPQKGDKIEWRYLADGLSN